MKRCAYCGKAALGNYSIHRDGFGMGPEVDLCDHCGGNPEPQEAQIWAKIGQSDECLKCEEEILSGDERVGSFHSWCFVYPDLPRPTATPS